MTPPSSAPEPAALTSILRQLALFHSLPDTDLTKVAAAMTVVEYAAGAEVYREDDLGDAFYVVLEGQLAVCKHRSSSIGDDETIVRLGAGDTFGELALLENAHRTATVRVLQACRLLRLASLDFQRLVVEVVGAQDIHELLQNVAYLRRLPFLSDCPADALTRFARCWLQAQYAAGESALKRGRDSNRFHLIYDGEFAVRADGTMLAQLGPGECFGETGLLTPGPATVDVVATEESRCLVLEREDFLAFAAREREVATRMEKLIAHRRREGDGGVV